MIAPRCSPGWPTAWWWYSAAGPGIRSSPPIPLLKGSKVDGIYTADPKKVTDAKRFDFLTFDQAIEGRYGVMDAAAFALCRDQHINVRVFDMTAAGMISQALGPNPPGTLVGELR